MPKTCRDIEKLAVRKIHTIRNDVRNQKTWMENEGNLRSATNRQTCGPL